MKDQVHYICDDGRHLVCIPYTIHNLHDMARELNINRNWFHGTMRKGKVCNAHYDIPKQRIQEIKAKCYQSVSTMDILRIINGQINHVNQLMLR